MVIDCYTPICMAGINKNGNAYWDSHIFLVQMQNGTITLENSLAVSYQF